MYIEYGTKILGPLLPTTINVRGICEFANFTRAFVDDGPVMQNPTTISLSSVSIIALINNNNVYIFNP